MKLVHSPWSYEFEQIVSSARCRLRIAAPYFSRDILLRIVKRTRRGVEIDFLLSLSHGEVLAGVQSATAVRELQAVPNCRIRLVRNLHAKFLVSDESCVLVTSSNLTNNGLNGNLELGVRINDQATAQGLVRVFDQWFEEGNRIPPTAELDALCNLQRKAAKPGNGVDYGALITVRTARRQTVRGGLPQGWILVHSKAEYPSGTIKDPEMEMKKYKWRPGTWNWRHGKHGLKRDGQWRTLLLAWEGHIFCEARAMVVAPPSRPYNVQFKMTDCRRLPKVSLGQLGAPAQHRGLIRLTTAMLEKYHSLVGRSTDR